MRGATAAGLGKGQAGAISIHAPHAGSDNNDSRIFPRMDISIHAPHAGSDQSFSSVTRLLWTVFQSTLPMRGATSYPAE